MTLIELLTDYPNGIAAPDLLGLARKAGHPDLTIGRFLTEIVLAEEELVLDNNIVRLKIPVTTDAAPEQGRSAEAEQLPFTRTRACASHAVSKSLTFVPRGRRPTWPRPRRARSSPTSRPRTTRSRRSDTRRSRPRSRRTARRPRSRSAGSCSSATSRSSRETGMRRPTIGRSPP